MIDPLGAARIVSEANHDVEWMDIHRILWLANVAYFGQHGAPLVSGRFAAEMPGPIHTSIWHPLSPHRTGLPKSLDVLLWHPEHPSCQEKSYLLAVVKHIRGWSSVSLMTKCMGSAWAKRYQLRNNIITDEEIINEYRMLQENRADL